MRSVQECGQYRSGLSRSRSVLNSSDRLIPAAAAASAGGTWAAMARHKAKTKLEASVPEP